MTPIKVLWGSEAKFIQEKSKVLHFGVILGINTEWDIAEWTMSWRRGPGQVVVDVSLSMSQQYNLNKVNCILGYVTGSMVRRYEKHRRFPQHIWENEWASSKTSPDLCDFKTEWKLKSTRKGHPVLFWLFNCALHCLELRLNSFFVIRWNLNKHHFSYFHMCRLRYFSVSHGFIISLGYNLSGLQLLMCRSKP